jgi:parallel beta-helix repeat protein
MTGHDNLFDGNDVYDNAGYGYHLYNSGSTTVSNNIVRNSRLWGNGFAETAEMTAAIILSSGSNNQAYNNLIYHNSNGIQLDYSPTGANHKVYNNTLYGNANFAITNGTDQADIRNNIIVANGIAFQKLGTNGTYTTNLCDSAATGCTQVGDPLFVNASGSDFHLQSASPGRDKGVTLTVLTTDLEGTPRPQGSAYDIGAYEYHGALTAPAAPYNVRIVR